MSADKAESSAPAKVSKSTKQAAISASLQTLVAYLVDHPNNRPAKLETLKNHLSNILGGAVSEQEKAALIAELVSRGFAAVTGKKVDYNIPIGSK